MKKHIRSILIWSIRLYAPFYGLLHKKAAFFSHILIQTNNICTRKCRWCVYGISERIENITLPEEVFKKMIDELARINYCGRVSLFETNEPLTDNRIFDLLKYATEKLPRAWHFMNTNGDLLTPEKIIKLFDCGLDALDISSYDQDSFEKIEKILSQISCNKDRIRHFNKCAKEFITDNRGGSLKNIFKPEKKKMFCDRVNKILFIKPSGDAVSCFSDFFNENIMGSVKNESLEEIWRGRRFTELREHLNKCDRGISRICKECNYVGFGGYYKIPFVKHLQKRLKRKK